MIHQKELRFAIICYGGVSLAVYMHAVTKELWKLLKASEARRSGHAAEGDSEPHWRGLLDAIGQTTDLAVICDVMTGASAGGLNAVLLSNAITLGHDMEPLREMWLVDADVENLLDPEARPREGVSRWLSAFYKEPVAWYAARKSGSLASVDVPEVRAEVALKLAGFVRSRWFEPPFSGDVLTAMLDRAMDAMAAGDRGPPLIPPGLPLDLHVTVTDYWGVSADLPIHSPASVQEREHRRMFAFSSPAVIREPGQADGVILPPRLAAGQRPEQLLAARATASFPGAFPPATILEVDRLMAKKGEAWPGRAAFIDAQLQSDRPPEAVQLIDGSVLNNAPFGPAIAAVRTRPAHRDVDRRFIYIDPKPGIGGVVDALEGREPGFFTAILRALADIPREQPIRDSLEAINALSARIRRMRTVTDAMHPAVEAAIQRAIGRSFFLFPVSPARLAKARSRIQSDAAREAGFAFGAYAQLKLRNVLDDTAQMLGDLAGLGFEARGKLRDALGDAAAARGAYAHDEALGRQPESCGYVRLLRQLDIAFRVRRLRFFLRHLTAGIAATSDPVERDRAERLKARLHLVTGPFEARRRLASLPDRDGLSEAVEAVLQAREPESRVVAASQAIDRLAGVLGLSALDAEADRILVEAAADEGFGRDMRRDLIRSWLGFPFYDIAILPLMQEDADGGFEELKVDRISPDDAAALRDGGTRACLKGWQLNAFAAFFSRAYRENDYLWGRLHAAERLVDIVLSAVPDADVDPQPWKARIFRAILTAERPHLDRIGPLFDELEGVLAQWEQQAGH